MPLAWVLSWREWFCLRSGLQGERDIAVERAGELQKQHNDLQRDHEKLRKVYLLDLQKKVCYGQIYVITYYACILLYIHNNICNRWTAKDMWSSDVTVCCSMLCRQMSLKNWRNVNCKVGSNCKLQCNLWEKGKRNTLHLRYKVVGLLSQHCWVRKVFKITCLFLCRLLSWTCFSKLKSWRYAVCHLCATTHVNRTHCHVQLNVLNMQRERQLFEEHVAQLGQQLVQMKADLVVATEQRDAVRGQLGDLIVSRW